MAQTSYSVSPGDTILAADHNAVVTDLTDLYAIKLNSSSFNFASQAEAEAGTDTGKVMNSLRVKQAINYNVVLASQAEAEGGTNETHFMNPLRTAQAIAKANIQLPHWLLTGGDQTITTATETDLTWGTEILDSNSFHSGSDANITIPTGYGGVYMINFYANFENTGIDKYFYVYIVKNSTEYARFYYSFEALSSSEGIPQLANILLPLADGDTCKIVVSHNKGSDALVYKSSSRGFFSGVKIA